MAKEQMMLVTGAIAMIVLVLTVAIGATTLQQVRSVSILDISQSAQIRVTNESMAAAVANVPQTLTTITSQGTLVNDTDLVVANATQNPISIANYSVNVGNGSVTPFWSGSIFNVTYDYTINVIPHSRNITSNGLIALDTYSDFFQVIVVTIVFAAIIGLFVFFIRKPSGGGL